MADTSKRTAKAGAAKRKSKTGQAGKRTSTSSRSSPSERRTTSSAGRRNGRVSASDAVNRGRRELSQLLGRPVEAMLGASRDNGNWVVTAQVLELARIPNTTDVLAEYEAVLDRDCEVVSYKRTRRYHRGAVDSGQ